MQKENVSALRKVGKASAPPPSLAIDPPSIKKKDIILVQWLSPIQMKERRDKGLYYNCDDKWGSRHKCKAAQLFIIDCEDSTNEDEPKPPKGVKFITERSSKTKPKVT